jgi:chaperonin GroES
MQLKPIGDRVLVRLVENQTKSILHIPDSAKEVPTEAIVLELGIGNEKKFHVAVGDRVIVSKYGGTEIKSGDHAFKIFNASDILAIIVDNVKKPVQV